MFTIFLWDRAKYAKLAQIDNMLGNETFLIQSDDSRFPLLSDLADCAEDIHCESSLPKLSNELKELKKELNTEQEIAHIDEIIKLTDQAILENKCILFTPFLPYK